MKKNRGQKSRDTAPLIQAKTIFIHNKWLGRYNNTKNVETEVWLLTIFFADFKRAGHNVEGFYFLYRYGVFTLYFLSRSFVVRERNAGECEKRPDSIT